MRILDAHACFMQHRPLSHWVVLGIGIFLAYAGVALLITWPLAANLGRVLPGTSGDTLLHYWNGWATKQALAGGQSLFFTNLIFYPQGVSLVTHNMAWFQIGPWLLLDQLMDGIVAYNLTLLFNLTLCGCAAFILSYKLSADWKPAFLAGMIYMAWPFRLSQLDHPNLLATQWIPIFMFFLIRTLENGRWRDAILTAVTLALVGYGRWQLLIPAAIMGLIYVSWSWRLWWPKAQRPKMLRLMVAAGLVIVFLLPPAWLLVQEQQNSTDAADLFREGEESIMQSDLLAYVTPSNGHFLLRDLTTPIYDKYYEARFSSRRYSPYIGFVTLILAIVALIKKSRQALPWFLMALVMILLAMGPLLRVNGIDYPEFPMLYRLLEPLQVIRLMRVPDRFNMFLALPMAILAGYGMVVILSRLRSRWTVFTVYGILLFLLLLEYLVIPVPLYEVPTPSAFSRELAAESGSFSILNLPFDSLKAKSYMFEQVTHQRPLVQGNLSRIPPGAYRTIDSNPWLNTLHHEVEMDPSYIDVGRQLANLAAIDIRYLIIHKDLVGADRIQHWQRYLLTTPYYEDDAIIVYRTEPQIDQDFELDAQLAPGLGPVRQMISADCVTRGNTLEIDIGWGAGPLVTREYLVELALVDEDGASRHTEIFPLADKQSPGRVPASTLVWGYYKLSIPKDIPTGVYDLVLTLQGETSRTETSEAYVLQQILIQDDVCDLDPVNGATDANASFGDRLRLLAYDVEQNDNLDLRLYWQAEQRMGNNYKIFVHVFDRNTGIPVAQDDAMPHRNAYPTRFWGLEEVVDDHIRIPLQGVPAGSYGLAIGVYDPVSGERLQVIDGYGNIAEDGRLVLPETVLVP